MSNIVVHLEDPNEEAEVETVGALKDWYGGQHLAVGRCWQSKKWTQGDGGSQKKLATSCRRMIHHDFPARHKGHSRQGPSSDTVARGAPKGRKLDRRQQMHLECNKGIKDRGARRWLCLGSKKGFNKTIGQPLGLKVAKWAVDFSIGLREVSDWTLWRGQPPPKPKTKRPNRSPRKRTEMMVVHLDWFTPY
jgi:hypothetical protein